MELPGGKASVMLSASSILLRLNKLDECLVRLLERFRAFALTMIEGDERRRDGAT